MSTATASASKKDVQQEVLVYAYRVVGYEQFGVDSQEVRLAYQVRQPLASFQCDFPRGIMEDMLRNDIKDRGVVRIVRGHHQLALPLSLEKELVPVTTKMLSEYGVLDLVRLDDILDLRSPRIN